MGFDEIITGSSRPTETLIVESARAQPITRESSFCSKILVGQNYMNTDPFFITFGRLCARTLNARISRYGIYRHLSQQAYWLVHGETSKSPHSNQAHSYVGAHVTTSIVFVAGTNFAATAGRTSKCLSHRHPEYIRTWRNFSDTIASNFNELSFRIVCLFERPWRAVRLSLLHPEVTIRIRCPQLSVGPWHIVASIWWKRLLLAIQSD